MRICFFIQWLNAGGAERTIASLSNYFVNHNNEVDIVMLGNVIKYDLDDRINIFQIDEFNGPEKIFSIMKAYGRRKRKFKEYIKKENPDIVVCLLTPVLLYTRGVKKPIICSERNNPLLERGKIKRVVTNYLYSKTEGIIFQTEQCKNLFCKKIKNKGIVIPNPIGNVYNGKIFSYRERSNKITAVGRLHPAKDYFTLIDAVKLIFDRHKDFILEIYGDGPLKEKLQNYVEKNGLRNKVVFCGVHKDALLRISDSKCYVLSSLYEGMPNTLLEALGAGIPSISTNCDFGPSVIINNGENGILVPVKDPIKMAIAIEKMISNEEFSNKCSANARKMLKDYSLDSIANRYYLFFSEVIEKNKKLC